MIVTWIKHWLITILMKVLMINTFIRALAVTYAAEFFIVIR